MRILITGVTGQVGSALLQALASQGTSQGTSKATLLPADRSVLDLTKPGEIAGRLNELQPDVIINPAAYTAVDRAEDERDLAFTVNGDSPGAIARWAADGRVPMIQLSTDYVFAGTGSQPWREDDPTAPLSVYGASKLAGEQAVERAGGAHLIVRTCWVYAARGANFMRTIARLAGEREELRIVADQFGAPTAATWIAEAISQILAQDRPDLAGGFERAGHRLHLAAGGETNWHGFAHAIVAGLERRGVPVKTRSIVAIATKDYPVKASRPLNSRLDLSRLAGLYGIVPPAWDVQLERELDRFVADFRATRG